jgi:hypothetical protein
LKNLTALLGLSAQGAHVASDTKFVEDLTPVPPTSEPSVTGAQPLQAGVKSNPTNRNKDWNPSIWSFLCLIAGIALLTVSPGLLFISASLFLASFVLSIVAVAKRHFASGMIMMILLCIVPPICILRAFAVGVSTGVQKVAKDGPVIDAHQP